MIAGNLDGRTDYMARVPSFYIQTYGCQMNVYDSDLIDTILSEAGFTRTCSLDEADIVLVNTCAVREHAERRALGRAAELASRKQRRAGLIVGICGCVAQRLGRSAVTEVPLLDLIVGPSCYRMLPELIRGVMEDGIPRYALDLAEDESYGGLQAAAGSRVTAFLAIMRGCDNWCSYCIVPYVRGPERSRSQGDIATELRALGEAGIRDVTLLGQNVVAYRHDGMGFADLLRSIDAARYVKRVRFTTSHPRDMDDSVIEAMSTLETVCEHLHLPLQSGSKRTLERMNRQYTPDTYRMVVDKLRDAVQGIALSTDVIVGFPGETESDFRETLAMVKEIEFDYAYMFRFSPRAGTPAASMEPQVPEAVRRARLAELIGLQNGIIRRKNAELIGREVEVLVEGPSHQRGDELLGRTRTNKVIVFPGGRDLIGSFVRVRPSELRGWTPWGHRIERRGATRRLTGAAAHLT
jgi:tRNA-2-methylthio-N6-dimethylallyladenosine synthase